MVRRVPFSMAAWLISLDVTCSLTPAPERECMEIQARGLSLALVLAGGLEDPDNDSLLVPKRFQGIDSRRPACWNITSQERHTDQQYTDSDECERVGNADIVEITLYHPRHRQRQTSSDCNTNQGEPHALRNHQAQNVAPSRTEGHTNSHLMGTFTHSITHHAVGSEEHTSELQSHSFISYAV